MSRGYFNETVTPALHFKAVLLSSFVSTLKYFPSVSILPDLTIYFSNSFFSHSCLCWNTECAISFQLGSLFALLPFFYVLCVNLLSQVVYLPDPARKQYFWGFIAPDSSAESNLTSLLHLQKQQRIPQRTKISARSFLLCIFMADEKLQVRGLFIRRWIIQMSIFRMKNRNAMDNSCN